ncbi:MAG TPA: hypothetical protein DGD08_08515 [Gemmatimonas aurantiaca]|uniref:DUF4157 domain-containing protein n=2 Tax=Gemmatimonas aurantiaca TaxID=173480 RepID=C1A449_GEMAT|nr:hypothetical protein [Gemmatimonas aurantiaca]BAH38874.1 hypothetical protein GAU_1832 [Gemmatimonas aurantiaca T-27]HCT57241.1 hypothetical protein [Gemmatimonas aurantiaca]
MAFRLTLHGIPVRVQTNVRPLAWIGVEGMTFAPLILLAMPAYRVDAGNLAHEFRHVQQVAEMDPAGKVRLWNTVKFVADWIWQRIWKGYKSIPVEADAHAKDDVLARSVPIVNAVALIRRGGR